MIKKQLEKIIQYTLRQRYGMVKGDFIYTLISQDIAPALDKLEAQEAAKVARWLRNKLGDNNIQNLKNIIKLLD
jgi:hypothetical protein